jgi:transposase-like protein
MEAKDKMDALIDELVKSGKTLDELLAEGGELRQMYKRLAERTLEAEMTAHLGYEPHASVGRGSGNSRNGKSKKTLTSDHGPVDIAVPRDRNGSFEPRFVRKHQRRAEGFDDRIIALYARGMSTREIQSFLEESYGVEVSPAFISQVTDAVLDEVRAWQARPLDAVYPIVYLDALVTKSRQEGAVSLRHVYVALGVNLEGEKELLGLWLAQSEGAKFWLSILSELKNRGVQDVLIACVDGLKGFGEAIEAVYPQTQVQQCIVHQVRHSLHYVPWKERKAVAAALRRIYISPSAEMAERELATFESVWGEKYPRIGPSWRNNWARLSVFYDYPPEIRKVIYTTNAVESLNASLQKVLKQRKAFPNDEAILKVLYLALHQVARKWTMPVQNWKQALNQLSILFGDRLGI